jgi:hypothetical protein
MNMTGRITVHGMKKNMVRNPVETRCMEMVKIIPIKLVETRCKEMWAIMNVIYPVVETRCLASLRGGTMPRVCTGW